MVRASEPAWVEALVAGWAWASALRRWVMDAAWGWSALASPRPLGSVCPAEGR